MNADRLTLEISPGQYKFLIEKGHVKLEGILIATGHTITLICGNRKPVRAFCWMGYNINANLSSNLKLTFK